MIARRAVAILALTLGWLATGVPPALADPPGPTDYRTEVVSITPPTAEIEIRIIGGDSFIHLTAAPGARVEVIGYRGEPYLRFLPEGTVERNVVSPSTFLNEDRYGNVEPPPTASPDLEPVWEPVASNGSYAWHDHRSHWMNERPPPGAAAGDIILEAVVPLVVNGVEVDVAVVSTLLPAPSIWPAAGGLLAGIAAGTIALLRDGRWAPLVTGLLAILAAAGGVIAYLSVPSETGPSPVLWLVPTLALLAAGAARFGPSMHRSTALVAGTVLLVVWAIVHREWIWRAILPTGAPFWYYRAVTAAAFSGGLLAGLAVARGVRRSPRPGA